MRKLYLLFLIIITTNLSYSQEVLTNQSIIDLIELGFDEQVIIDKIESSETNFDTTIDALKILKEKGVLGKVLSSMIKKSKKVKDTVTEKSLNPNESTSNIGDELNNLEYSFSIGIDKYTVHLMKDEYFKEFKGPVLEALIVGSVTLAKLEMKNTSTYKPTFVQLTRNKNGKNKITILGTAQNDYGATKDTFFQKNFNYTYEEKINENLDDANDKELYLTDEEDFNNLKNFDYKSDKNNIHINFKDEPLFGKISKKMTGKFIIGENYYVLAYNQIKGVNVEMPTVIFPIKKRHINENEWESKYIYKGEISTFRYDSKPNKYKSTGGTFTISSPSTGSIVYYLYLIK